MSNLILPPDAEDVPLPLFEVSTDDNDEVNVEPIEYNAVDYNDATIPYGIELVEVPEAIERGRAFELNENIDDSGGLDLAGDIKLTEFKMTPVKMEHNNTALHQKEEQVEEDVKPTMQRIMDDFEYARTVDRYVANDREVKSLDKEKLYYSVLHFAKNSEDRPACLTIWIRKCMEGAFVDILHAMVFSNPTVSPRRTIFRVETRDVFTSIRPLLAILMNLKQNFGLKITCEPVYGSCRSKTKVEKWIRAIDRFVVFLSYEEKLQKIPFSYVTTFHIFDEKNRPDQSVVISYEDDAVFTDRRDLQTRRVNISVDHVTNMPNSLFPEGKELFSSVQDFEIDTDEEMIPTHRALDPIHNFLQILQMHKRLGLS